MMYGINSTFLKYKHILDFINSTNCVCLFEPKDDVYYISFRHKYDKLELQKLVNEIIEQKYEEL